MSKRFIDNFEVILLDMGNTFMFECDRFDDAVSLYSAYTALGGTNLTDRELGDLIAALITRAMQLVNDPDYFDDFPRLMDVLCGLPATDGFGEDELSRLERIFALHERGTIPGEYSAVLHELRETHRLGLVSNIFSLSDLFHEALRGAGIRDLFDVIVFSSECGYIKPSAKLFERALSALESPPERIVHVGDTFKRDVVGAKSAGLSCVWIARGRPFPSGFACAPDLVINDLRELPGAGDSIRRKNAKGRRHEARE